MKTVLIILCVAVIGLTATVLLSHECTWFSQTVFLDHEICSTPWGATADVGLDGPVERGRFQ